MVEEIIISDPIDHLAGHGIQPARNNVVNAEAEPMRQVIPGLSNDRRQYEFCRKLNACGHACLGVQGETECIPCMDPTCKEPAEVIQP